MADRTIAQMEQEVRDRADAPSTNFPTSTEVERALNQSIATLRDLIMDAGGHEAFLTSASIPLVAGTSTYALPNGTLYSAAAAFYRLFGVDISLGSGVPVTLRPFNFAERNQYVPGAWNPEVARYRLQGTNILFIPTPTTGRTATLWYAPVHTTLATSDTWAIGRDIWVEHVILDVACKYANKARLDETGMYARKEAMLQQILQSEAHRDQSMSGTVTDVEGVGIDPFWRGF